MPLTRTDKQFIGTMVILLLLGATALWMVHFRGREKLVAEVIEFHRVAPGHVHIPIVVGTRTGATSIQDLSLRTQEHLLVSVSVEGETVSFSAPVEKAPIFESGLVSVSFKRNRQGYIRIYQFSEAPERKAP